MTTKRSQSKAKTAEVATTPADQARLAKLIVSPHVRAAQLIARLGSESVDGPALGDELKTQIATIHSGDMERPEAMLTAQAHSLDGLFNALAHRSLGNMEAGYGEAAERYMKMALRAQSQCRATLETLAEIKAPRAVAFIAQANVTHGPQQVNNHPQPARAANSAEMTNELLETNHGERMDTRTTGAASGADKAMATLGAIDGATNTSGQGHRQR